MRTKEVKLPNGSVWNVKETDWDIPTEEMAKRIGLHDEVIDQHSNKQQKS